jgi:glycerate 2-kinase
VNQNEAKLREDALAIWTAAVEAADAFRLTRDALISHLSEKAHAAVMTASRILVVGGGKAGAAMAAGLEAALAEHLNRVEGIVNVPEGAIAAVQKIRLHPARPAGSNHPTTAGVAGCEEMLWLMQSAGPDDVAVCLLSGGGSALLPAPAEGITLEHKQAVTKLLHESGATIDEMNAVRKHLSRVKGGRLASVFRGKRLISLIISDVVGDRLDVIASGPTAPDSTTYADALTVIDKYDLRRKAPHAVLDVLTRGAMGRLPETIKSQPPNVENLIIGNNTTALTAARNAAEKLGYNLLDFGPFVEGETRQVAVAVAGIVRNIRERQQPVSPSACVLIGGETTVTLETGSGKGGRNQEFVLAVLNKLGREAMQGIVVLSGGTDGEDGPTDAAGAIGTAETLRQAERLQLSLTNHLRRHDAYPFFDATNGLIRTGLTGTNVMDVRVILVT